MATNNSYESAPVNGAGTNGATMPGTHELPPSQPPTMHTTSSNELHAHAKPAASSGHMLAMNDPDNPMAWPLWKKVYTSWAAFLFAFTV